jgi:hypothetical protein
MKIPEQDQLTIPGSAQVEVVAGPGRVYIYDAEGATHMVDTVRKAIQQTSPPGRIPRQVVEAVYEEVVRVHGGAIDEFTQLDVGLSFYVSAELTVTVECDLQQVRLSMQGHLHDKRVFTFEEFMSGFFENQAHL